MNQSEETGEKKLSYFGSRGGQISPLMHVPLSEFTVASYCCRVDIVYFVLFVWFDLGFFTPKSTAMVMSGRSVHLSTLFTWEKLTKQFNTTSLSLVTNTNSS